MGFTEATYLESCRWLQHIWSRCLAYQSASTPLGTSRSIPTPSLQSGRWPVALREKAQGGKEGVAGGLVKRRIGRYYDLRIERTGGGDRRGHINLQVCSADLGNDTLCYQRSVPHSTDKPGIGSSEKILVRQVPYQTV